MAKIINVNIVVSIFFIIIILKIILHFLLYQDELLFPYQHIPSCGHTSYENIP